MKGDLPGGLGRRLVAGLALLAEGAGDLPAEPVSFLEQPGPFFQQLAVLGVGGLQAAQQGGVGGALAGWDWRCR